MKKPIARLSLLAALALLLALALTAGASAFISAGDGGWFSQGEQPRDLPQRRLHERRHPRLGGGRERHHPRHHGRRRHLERAELGDDATGSSTVAFSDATHGWAVGFGTILATTNGGATWSAQSSGGEDLFGVAFSDASSRLGGGRRRHHPRHHQRRRHLEQAELRDHRDALRRRLQRCHPRLGGGRGRRHPRHHQRRRHLGRAELGDHREPQGRRLSDATHGWAVGGDGPILATTNGGATWSTQNSGTRVPLRRRLQRRHSRLGGGRRRRHPRHHQRRRHLERAELGEQRELFGVAFSDATHGWAVGGDGTILATTTGGVPPAPAAPSIAGLKPASAKRGALVTISGADFGAARGTSAVKFGSTPCTKYVSWSDGRIKCKVPAKAKYGVVKVTVTTTAGKSNALSFRVKR